MGPHGRTPATRSTTCARSGACKAPRSYYQPDAAVRIQRDCLLRFRLPARRRLAPGSGAQMVGRAHSAVSQQIVGRTHSAVFQGSRTMRWAFAAAMFCLALGLCSGALAESRLGVSDRLKIKVQEWPDLGGEYAIRSDGFVSIPLIGDLKAAGLQVQEFGQEISNRVQKLGDLEKRPFTAVEVVQKE